MEAEEGVVLKEGVEKAIKTGGREILNVNITDRITQNVKKTWTKHPDKAPDFCREESQKKNLSRKETSPVAV